MTLEEVKEKLKVFDKYTFEEDTHTYYCNGVKVGIGVTSLIGLYANKFDEQDVAEMVANSNQKKINDIYRNPLIEHEDIEYASTLETNVSKIIEEWHYKRDFSCEKGTTIHEYTQSLFSGNEWHLRPFDNSEEYLEVVEKIKHHSNNYYNDYKDRYIHIKDELLIGVEWADVSSAIDHLFYDKVDKGFVIVDYKTNSYMDGYYDNPDKKVYKKYMMIPFQDTLDNSYEHYKIQLSIYKYILQELLGIPILRTEIVYLTENKDNYEVIQIPYEKEKAELMLEIRRVKNMNSVPILLIGASGTGKSTSLRNFTRDEVAVVNVLGKPLPFKSDIKAPQCDDYAKILKAIDDTKKKTVVIDDAGYLITNEFMGKSSIKGFDKYNEMANNFFNLINGIKKLKGGKTVYIIMHEDTNEDGDVKPKTIGKLLDDKVNLQGMFTICIRSMFENGNYIFRLKTNGQDCVKTPFGMFENDEMENDLKAFDKVVREYYDLDKSEEREGEE